MNELMEDLTDLLPFLYKAISLVISLILSMQYFLNTVLLMRDLPVEIFVPFFNSSIFLYILSSCVVVWNFVFYWFLIEIGRNIFRVDL